MGAIKMGFMNIAKKAVSAAKRVITSDTAKAVGKEAAEVGKTVAKGTGKAVQKGVGKGGKLGLEWIGKIGDKINGYKVPIDHLEKLSGKEFEEAFNKAAAKEARIRGIGKSLKEFSEKGLDETNKTLSAKLARGVTKGTIAVGGAGALGAVAAANGIDPVQTVKGAVDGAVNTAGAVMDGIGTAGKAAGATLDVAGKAGSLLADGATLVGGLIGDISNGDLSGAMNHITDFAKKHPMALALGGLGTSVALGGVMGPVGKIALAGVGLMAGWQMMAGNATSDKAADIAKSFNQSGITGVSAEAQKGAQAATQVQADAQAQQDMATAAVDGMSAGDGAGTREAGIAQPAASAGLEMA